MQFSTAVLLPGLNMPRIICVPSCHAALPRMTLMLNSLCKEELTRQPIFNSSAPPLEDELLLKHGARSEVSCATVPHVRCVCLCFLCVCDGKMPDNNLKVFWEWACILVASHRTNRLTKNRITFHSAWALESISVRKITSASAWNAYYTDNRMCE